MPSIYVTDKAKLPKRSEYDHYATEHTLINAILPEEMGQGVFNILDPGCGDGRWGRLAFQQSGYMMSSLTTVDIDPRWNPYGNRDLMRLYEIESDVTPEHFEWDFSRPGWSTHDSLTPVERFDYVVGNFPYGPTVQGHRKVAKVFQDHGWSGLPEGMKNLSMAEIFIRRSWELLKPGGKIICLLESQFASSMDRYNGLWLTHSPMRQWVCSRRPSFYAGKTNATEFSVFVWQKSMEGDNLAIPRSWQVELLAYEREQDVSK